MAKGGKWTKLLAGILDWGSWIKPNFKSVVFYYDLSGE